MLRIRELRTARGMTQEALAYKAGVALGTVRRAERLGRAGPESLQRLAHALNVPIGELFVPGIPA